MASLLVVIIAPRNFLDELLHLHVNNLVFLCDAKRKLLLLRTGGAHKNDALGPSRSISVLELENAVDLLNDTILVIAARQLCHEALTNVLDTSNLQIVFEDGIARYSLPLLLVHAACSLSQIPYHSFGCLLVFLFQEDELIGYDTHLLEGYCLGLSPREAFYDPTLLSLFDSLYLFFDQLNYDFIANVTVGLKRLLDLLTVLLVLLSDLASDKVAH